MNDLVTIRDRFREVNGEHPMTEADDAYAREHFRPATADQLADIAVGRLPLPAYVLSDGTPVVADISEVLAAAGGVAELHDWFVEFWPGDPATAEFEWDTFLSGQYVCLRTLDPITIRRRAVLLDQAQAAVDALRADPRDELAQGSLAEAVDGGLSVAGLDELLLPMTAYDRLRFGGPTVRDLWVDMVRAEFHDPQPPPLPLRTKRLTLRRVVLEDAPVRARAWTHPDFVRYLLHPERVAAETTFETYRHCQPPPEGPHRFLGLVMEHEGEPVGNVVLFFQGAGVATAEMGWTLYPWAAGKGLATEAATELLRVAFEHYGVRRVVANLDAENQRSAALAERLGMRRESHKLADFWSKGRWTDSYEYAILRGEWEAQHCAESAPDSSRGTPAG
ncbi:GNAT family N-acetyltransferase [Nocardioides sp.]|uniref:GNAT family N-acetyltransferase n=1 Tax=Nocardioides sp. TaxID=35761 RepID=UPI002C41B9CB|nr:GNAT family N-acetyltransferase [Nocardioides sp.]HXH80857.1 GNAT family N-acetyltransferase [Nocardioides sp.]